MNKTVRNHADCEDQGWVGAGIWGGDGREALTWEQEGTALGRHRPVWDPVGVRSRGPPRGSLVQREGQGKGWAWRQKGGHH